MRSVPSAPEVAGIGEDLSFLIPVTFSLQPCVLVTILFPDRLFSTRFDLIHLSFNQPAASCQRLLSDWPQPTAFLPTYSSSILCVELILLTLPLTDMAILVALVAVVAIAVAIIHVTSGMSRKKMAAGAQPLPGPKGTPPANTTEGLPR